MPTVVRRLLETLGQDEERFKNVLETYTTTDQGDSLHVQALNNAQFGENDENEISALFIIEKVVQDLGFIADHENPTKSTSCLDPWAQKYTLQDIVLVMTLLTFSVVRGKVLRKPDGIRYNQGSRKAVPTQAVLDQVREERENAGKKLVQIREIRDLYGDIEERMLGDLLDFHESMKGKPEEMMIFTKSRIEVFENWQVVSNKRKQEEVSKKGGGGGAGQDSKEEKRRRLSKMLKGIYEDD